ncbi:hypothetical protein ACRAWD_20345 [Caulobacter segnis]
MRGQLAWTPTDRTDVLLSIHAGQDKSEPTGLYLFNPLSYNASLPVIAAGGSRKNTGWGGLGGLRHASRASRPTPGRSTTPPAAASPLRAHTETGGVDLVLRSRRTRS